MRILIVSSYHGGSHRAWAEGYTRYSAHDVELLALPARFWKWRMHGGAITLARRYLESLSSGRQAMPDLLLFTDMVDLTTFMALTRRENPTLPAVLYMHENQLTYPLPEKPDTGPMRRQRGERDLHYAFINLASMLAADRVYFNSEFHRRQLLSALPRYLRHFPEFNELAAVATIEAKSDVLPPGIDGAFLDGHAPGPASQGTPLLIWNQRWEFDKDPKTYFDAVTALANEGLDFQVAVCGERFAREPAEFLVASRKLREHIIHWGYAQRDVYRRLLWQATVTASTALHEFFGISIVEAMYCQTYAILPRRLSYPELLPEDIHGECLYDDHDGLMDRLRWSMNHSAQAQEVASRLAKTAAAYDWRSIASRYDAEFERLL